MEVLKLWDRFSRYPAGKVAFSKVLGFVAPYSGSIRPRVVRLDNKAAEVEMADRRSLRNNQKSLHAAALANLAELTGSLAILANLSAREQMIPTRLEIDYLKKARGKIIAIAKCDRAAGTQGEQSLDVTLRDASGTVVARSLFRCTIRERK